MSTTVSAKRRKRAVSGAAPRAASDIERTCRDLERIAVAVVRRLRGRAPFPSVSVFLLPGAELRRLKLEHCFRRAGRRRPARLGSVGVLAFPEPARFPRPERRGAALGEVYLNSDLRSEPKRLRALLVHGVLHLLGYRHGRKRDTIAMETLERKLVAELTRRE
jgi:hypothetical protein